MVEVASRLGELKHRVTVVTTDFPHHLGDTRCKMMISREKRKFRWIKLSGIHLPIGSPFISVGKYEDFLSMVKENDVMYFNCCPPNNFLIAPLIRLAKKPIVCAFHFFLDPDNLVSRVYYKTVLRRTVASCKAFHVLNKKSRMILESWHLSNVYYIPNGVDTSKFKFTDSGKGEKFKVLYIGSLTYTKGVDILCTLIEKLSNSDIGKNLFFTIVGSGPFEDLVVSLSETDSNIQYISSVPHRSLPKIYSSHDLLLMPSRKEGMPLVALEAQSCGLPIIASDISGLSDIVINGKTGSLLHSLALKDLIAEVTRYYYTWEKDYDQFKEIRVRARRCAVEKFNIDNTVCRLDKMFKEVASL